MIVLDVGLGVGLGLEEEEGWLERVDVRGPCRGTFLGGCASLRYYSWLLELTRYRALLWALLPAGILLVLQVLQVLQLLLAFFLGVE